MERQGGIGKRQVLIFCVCFLVVVGLLGGMIYWFAGGELTISRGVTGWHYILDLRKCRIAHRPTELGDFLDTQRNTAREFWTQRLVRMEELLIGSILSERSDGLVFLTADLGRETPPTMLEASVC